MDTTEPVMTMVNIRLVFLLAVLAMAWHGEVIAQAASGDDQHGSVAMAPPEHLASQPLIIRAEVVGLPKSNGESVSPWWSYFVPVVGPVISGTLAFLGAWLGLRIAQKNTLRTIEVAKSTAEASVWQKANENEIREIQEKLDKFFFPFAILSRENHQFAQDIRARQANKSYRMLVNLFDRKWVDKLSIGDRKAVEIVCQNAELMERFITEKVGAVDVQILPYLSRARAHFRTLGLAFKGELGTDAARFEDYVYPIQLDAVLKLEVERLMRRSALLRANPGTPPPPLESLVIPEELRLSPWMDPDGRLEGVVVTDAALE